MPTPPPPVWPRYPMPERAANPLKSRLASRSCRSDAPPRYSDAMPESEKRLIERIRRQAQAGVGRARPNALVTGIGDDAAVLRLPSNHDLLVTTDFSIEGVHFRREWHPPDVVGWRCLTRGLSDIAAMGGEPVAAFLSLAVSSDIPQRWIDEFVKGLLALAQTIPCPSGRRRYNKHRRRIEGGFLVVAVAEELLGEAVADGAASTVSVFPARWPISAATPVIWRRRPA